MLDGVTAADAPAAPPPHDALVVVSFGGPEGPDDVVPFLERVTAGRGIPRERLAEVGAHYALFGGVSPINAQNRALVAAVRDELVGHGHDLPVFWGNRNWHPLLADTVAEMADAGVLRALAFVTSAYGSYSGCRQYLDDIARARAEVGPRAPVIDKLRTFHDHPGFVEPFREHVRAALATVPPERRSTTCVLCSAHSVPMSQADTTPYLAQLRETSALVAEAAAPDVPWSLVFQSRSGPPQVPWLEPDVGDALAALAADGVTDVVLVPVGFTSDHMEVVYDLDTQVAERAAAFGVRLLRVPTPGTHPAFVAMVRELVEERLDPAAPRRALGRLGPGPDVCAAGCCPAPVRPRPA
jgi:protoporphyrin/coproporphyrin ferrochelatase